MNNFGVIEVATLKKASAPGWAYVPDVAAQPSAPEQPANRKRARNTGQGASVGDVSARQEARIRKEVEALEKDAMRDNTIPLPARAGRVATKSTPNVRKILQSQKTFANYLDDYLALQQSEAYAANAAANNIKRKASAVNVSAATTPKPTTYENSILVRSAPLATTATTATSAHDDSPLLAPRVPSPPSDAEVRALLARPTLSYLEARGTYDASSPARVFCVVCGYWGRVRCMNCGSRACAFNCLEVHKAGCIPGYQPMALK